jgi:hypothetical protein
VVEEAKFLSQGPTRFAVAAYRDHNVHAQWEAFCQTLAAYDAAQRDADHTFGQVLGGAE